MLKKSSYLVASVALVLALAGCGAQETSQENTELNEEKAENIVEEPAAVPTAVPPEPEAEPEDQPEAEPEVEPEAPVPSEQPVAPEPLTVLLVVEDMLSGRPDFTSSDEIAASLDALEVDYDTWSTYYDGAPDASTLADYDALIWAVGDDCCDSPPQECVDVMVDYLNQGGNLLIEGGSVVYIWGDDPFTREYLGIQISGYGPLGDVVVGETDHPLAEGFQAEPLDLSVSGFEPPDSIEATESVPVFVRGPQSAQAGYAAITAHESDRYRAVLSVVPLQWLSGPDRERLLENTLAWFASGSLAETSA